MTDTEAKGKIPDPSSKTMQAVADFFRDHADMDALLPLVYGRLTVLAKSARRSVDQHSTLNTTALVNEAYLRLRTVPRLDIDDRNRFFALCAQLMRRILVDHARKRSAAKRQAIEDPALEVPRDGIETLLGIDAAIETLRSRHPRLVELIECRFFAGYTQDETAQVLGLSDRTIRRDWLKAKALLIAELEAP